MLNDILNCMQIEVLSIYADENIACKDAKWNKSTQELYEWYVKLRVMNIYKIVLKGVTSGLISKFTYHSVLIWIFSGNFTAFYGNEWIKCYSKAPPNVYSPGYDMIKRNSILPEDWNALLSPMTSF